MDIKTNAGLSAKKLGFGMMRLPLLEEGSGENIDLERLCRMVDRFLEAGCTYFDTAAPYHKGCSETAFRECVVKRYARDSYTITDKLSLFDIRTADEIPDFFDRQLTHCGVSYFDYYLIHAVNRNLWKKAESLGAFDFVAKKKEEGYVKHIGFSFHDSAEILDEILTAHPEMEYVQLQINYIDWEDPQVQSRKCYEVCQKHGKPVIVMEPVKGGLLASIPEDVEQLLREAAPGFSAASWAVRYAASLDNVVMVLSGMSTEEQMEDNLSYMKDFKPLTTEEIRLIRDAADAIKAKENIACTACRYCVDGCPKKIAIPDYFRFMNEISKYGELQRVRSRRAYERFTKERGRGKASDCIGCRRCERSCPQHLTIVDYLKDVAAALE